MQTTPSIDLLSSDEEGKTQQVVEVTATPAKAKPSYEESLSILRSGKEKIESPQLPLKSTQKLSTEQSSRETSRQSGDPSTKQVAKLPVGVRFQYMDQQTMKMARLFQTGEKEVATMTEGPGGFQVARFLCGDIVATEVPNLLLQNPQPKARAKGKAKQKAKAEGSVQKKPAARQKQESDVDVEDEEAEEEAAEQEEEEEAEAEAEAEEENEEPADEENAAASAAESPEVVRQLFKLGSSPVASFKPSVTEYEHGVLKMTWATNKSYIQIKKEAGKWESLCNLEGNLAKQRDKSHKAVMLAVWKAILSQKICDKDAIKLLRDEFLQSQRAR